MPQTPTIKYFLASAALGSDEPRMTITTPVSDREGDRVVPEGGDFKNFLKNPVLCYVHDYKQIPIGRVTSLEVQPGKGIDATWKWLENDELADRVKNAWDQGCLNASSIGFIPVESTPNGKGSDITAWEMLELTLCPIPMNPTAVRAMKSLGFFEKPDAAVKKTLVHPAMSGLLKAIEKYFGDPQVPRPSGYDVSDATHAINVLHQIGTSEVADGHAHAAHIQVAAQHVIQYLQGEFNEQFGIAADGSPDISDAEIKDDADQPSATSTPFIPMDDDSKYPFVSATGLTGDAKLALIKGINDAVQPLIQKRGRRISAANEAKLKNAHAHLKAAHDTVGDVLACVKDEVEPTVGDGGDMDNLGGDTDGMIGLSLDDEDGVLDVELSTKDLDDTFDVDPAMLRATLTDVVRGSLQSEMTTAMQTAVDRARGRVVV